MAEIPWLAVIGELRTMKKMFKVPKSVKDDDGDAGEDTYSVFCSGDDVLARVPKRRFQSSCHFLPYRYTCSVPVKVPCTL